MSQILRSRLWWLILGVSMLGQAFGQGGATGAINGTVQDASGAVVANADVKIINQDTGTVTRVDKDGRHRVVHSDAAAGWDLHG